MLTRIASRPTDFCVTLLVLVGALVAAWAASGYPEAAGRWPFAIMMLLAVLCAYQLAKFLFAGPSSAEVDEIAPIPAPDGAVFRVGVSVALILGFVLLAPVAGLFSAAAVFLTAHMIALGIRPLLLALDMWVAHTGR